MRLIDADSLFNKLFIRNGKELPDNGYKNFPFTLGVKYIKEVIRNEPTAYDVDKLEDILEKMYAECWCEEDLEETYDKIRSMSAVCMKRRAEEIELDPDTVGY